MPTYEYRCHSCGHEFERFQKMSAKPVRTCPECGKRRVERLIGKGGGLVFKGPGFYATDYRAPPPKADAEAPAAGKADKKASGAAREKGGSSPKSAPGG